jgi:two-component system response regulator DctR
VNRVPQPRIAIVDDDEAVGHAMGFLLESLGQLNDVFASGDAFLAAEPKAYAGLITDYHMPRISGVQLVHELRTQAVVLPTLLVSGELTDAMVSAALAVGVEHFASKPVSTDQLASFLAATQ